MSETGRAACYYAPPQPGSAPSRSGRAAATPRPWLRPSRVGGRDGRAGGSRRASAGVGGPDGGGLGRGASAKVGQMANRDGNGWTSCGQGHRHWGRFGAAGLLAYAPCDPHAARAGAGVPGRRTASGRAFPGAAASGRVTSGRVSGRGSAPRAAAAPDGPPGSVCVLLQRRSWWGNHGGRWGPPGGARDSHESAVAAALREAEEECALPASAVIVRGILRDDHGGWSYQTVLASAEGPLPVRPVSSETSQTAWVPADDVPALALHPGFAARWPVLREALQPMTIIVDVANVMGSRPDGWWRDRAGAARRLRDQLAGLAGEGVAALPESVGAPALERWFPDFVLVVEGAARQIAAAHAVGSPDRRDQTGADSEPGERVEVVAARGSGDDTIAELAGNTNGRRLVVTADRQLRERCVAAGASVTGPSWLLGLL
jgi:8-oxo-dGTP diphosphatase